MTTAPKRSEVFYRYYVDEQSNYRWKRVVTAAVVADGDYYLFGLSVNTPPRWKGSWESPSHFVAERVPGDLFDKKMGREESLKRLHTPEDPFRPGDLHTRFKQHTNPFNRPKPLTVSEAIIEKILETRPKFKAEEGSSPVTRDIIRIVSDNYSLKDAANDARNVSGQGSPVLYW